MSEQGTGNGQGRSKQPKIGASMPATQEQAEQVETPATDPASYAALPVPTASSDADAGTTVASHNGAPVFVRGERVRWLGKAVAVEGVSFAAPGDEGIVVATHEDRVQVRIHRTARIQECDARALLPLPQDRFARIISDVRTEAAIRYGSQVRQVEDLLEEVRQTALACERTASTPSLADEDVWITLDDAPKNHYVISVPVCSEAFTNLYPDQRITMQVRRRSFLRKPLVVIGSPAGQKSITLDADQLRSIAGRLEDFSADLTSNDRLLHLLSVHMPKNLTVVLSSSGEAGLSLSGCGHEGIIITSASLRALAKLLNRE